MERGPGNAQNHRYIAPRTAYLAGETDIKGHRICVSRIDADGFHSTGVAADSSIPAD